jgi:hypothetical protein
MKNSREKKKVNKFKFNNRLKASYKIQLIKYIFNFFLRFFFLLLFFANLNYNRIKVKKQ